MVFTFRVATELFCSFKDNFSIKITELSITTGTVRENSDSILIQFVLFSVLLQVCFFVSFHFVSFRCVSFLFEMFSFRFILQFFFSSLFFLFVSASFRFFSFCSLQEPVLNRHDIKTTIFAFLCSSFC